MRDCGVMVGVASASSSCFRLLWFDNFCAPVLPNAAAKSPTATGGRIAQRNLHCHRTRVAPVGYGVKLTPPDRGTRRRLQLCAGSTRSPALTLVVRTSRPGLFPRVLFANEAYRLGESLVAQQSLDAVVLRREFLVGKVRVHRSMAVSTQRGGRLTAPGTRHHVVVGRVEIDAFAERTEFVDLGTSSRRVYLSPRPHRKSLTLRLAPPHTPW